VNSNNNARAKFVSAEEAVRHIPSHSRVVVGHAAGEPSVLLTAMVENYAQYEDVEIVHMVCIGKGLYTAPELRKHFRHNSVFVGKNTQEAIASGRGDFTPVYFYCFPALFSNGQMPVDVALIQVSPPDRFGFCSYGISNDYTQAAAQNARIVIAEINEQMPRTWGDNFIHLTEIDYAVKTNRPLLEVPPLLPSAIEEAIGEHCASLIEDGATLQLGIGGIPNALLKFLNKKKDLGIHSEMIADGVVDLIEDGVVTNKAKTIHPGKSIVTFLMGTKKLYDFAHNNPMIELYPVEYVNDPYIIRQNHKMVSINSCVQVDLMGQVASTTIGYKQISGVGGQVDFVRGAAMGKEGKSIIAMPSTNKGKTSKIVPILDEGAAVTTNRYDVQYIITEYGIADLRGKTLNDRGKALIEIAHPDFRDQLREVWERRYIYKETNKTEGA